MTATQSTDVWAPTWATHPGEHLGEYLDVRGMRQAEFARLAGITPKLVSEIVNQKNPVTPETAIAFERVLGLKAHIWTGLQANWDLFHARQKAREPSPERKSWLNLFPIAELKGRGVLPDTNDEGALLEGLLALFGIGKSEAYSARLNALAVHHRQTSKAGLSQHHVYAWLMLGERRARCMNLPTFDDRKFVAAVHHFRSLTREEPSEFEPILKSMCAEAGLALIFERPISKTCVFGSARWMDGERPIIQMSLRMKFNDHFWWTLFHECAHIILHRGKNFADDHKGQGGDGVETEADKWAETLLYGEDGAKRIVASRPRSAAAVRNWAAKLELHPGLVVGMLQHYGVLPYTHLNLLKAKFEWAQDPRPASSASCSSGAG
jgi:HTH-type transcriptional regulator / antitoxin HigA